MKSSSRLDSAIFQLTPTRTRCDLIISANGKTEKIASGLLNPFLAHLKTAQDQIAKGGYSILLEPEPGNDRTWFTKGTVERFVRFVSTPEILERVYTIESEILQIEEAIVIQGNNDMGLSTVEDKHAKPVGSSEGDKTVTDANEERAIVLYKPDSHPPEANGSIAQEGNSKVQLLKVLETRKSVLQKEQGMAFARAVAAGFDIDHMAPLVSFAECFGALRLMDACSRFVDLWKGKHETGQWLEIEAAETMSNRSDFSAINASGIMLSSMANKQNESHGDLASEDNGKAAIDASAEETRPMDHQVPVGQQGYFQGPFPHPLFPPWPVQSPRARDEKLRAFKADLQKMKKKKEEEYRKRLEALKMEREKRIAAKTAQLASSQKTRKQLPTKLAPSSVKGTKFSDSEPGSSSPPQRSKIRTASTGSSESHKASKSNKSSNGSHLPGNRLTRPVSSLPEPRKENSDGKPVIDKTVVMLECEKPSFPIVHPSQENMGVQKERYDNHDNLEKTDVISEYAAIRAPASPMEGVDIEPIQSQLQEQPRVYEVTTSYAEKEPPNSSSMYSAEKPYLAPLARLSSLEDPCTDNSEYGKAPSTNLEIAALGLETAKAQVSGFENLKLEKIPEVLEKPQAKTNASSGMDVAELSKSTYMELQWKKVHRYVIFMIDEKKNEVVVEKTGSPAESYDDFAASLPENDCRYAVYDFDFVTSENCQRSKIFFIAWSPAVSRIRAKMLYATSKARFRRELEGIHYEIQATDPTEMGLEVIRDRAN